jgi:ferredoxin/flavodoxin---NADP+ reductase
MSAADDRFYHPRITKRVDLGPNLWTIRVAVDGEFPFTAGQYATLGVEDSNQKRWERPYSIASSPYESEVEFFFELVPNGGLTPLLYKLQTGDELFMRKVPKGRFTLDTGGRRNHFLVCTVTGVAPYVSFVRTLYRDWKDGKFAGDHKLFLVNGASHSGEFGYCEELQRVAQEVPWLKYVPTVSRPWEDPQWTGERGRADDVLRKYSDQWGLNGENSVAYLCGHPEMIERSKGMLKRIGFSKEFMKEEIYWVPGKEKATP